METLEILTKYKLRHTDTRENILKVFSERNAALSHGDLEAKLNENFDRVTIYRTLKTYVDKGILHKILDDQGGVKYAMCKENCDTHSHNHDHVHFKCTVCGDTTCLENVAIPNIELPTGYTRNEINMLIQGICLNCK